MKESKVNFQQSLRRFRPFLYGVARALALLVFDVTLAGLVAWNALLVYVMVARLHMNDFGKFYYSAVAFLQGQDMYGPSPATLIAVSESYSQHFWNMNPPHFHLPLLPLALLPPAFALALWGVVSLLSLLASLGLIIREVGLKLTPWRCRLGLLGLLSFAGTGAIFVTGQLSFLLLLPVTLAWVEARRGRWTIAGVYLGLAMSVKLFLLIFVPYLVLRRQFRAAAGAGAGAALCYVAGLIVFGVDAHWSWLRAVASSNWAWASMNASVLGLLTRALAESPYYSPISPAPELIRPLWLAVAGLVGMFTLAAATSDSTDTAVDRGFALLLLGSQLISPLGWIYYLWLPLGPIAALVTSWCNGHESGRVSAPSRMSRWRSGLLLGTIPGLVWPFPAVMLLQPHPWITVLLGSLYFWATLALWSSLIVDWHVAESAEVTAVGPRAKEMSLPGQMRAKRVASRLPDPIGRL